MDTSNIVSRFVKVVAIDESNELRIKRIANDDKSVLNGHKIIELDLSANTNIDAIFPHAHSSLISLNLSQCNLNYIPDAFKDLKINELNLSHNSFKTVPACITDGLKFLQVLDLSHNGLMHLPEPKCVKKLRVLLINNNKLINIPLWILRLHSFNLEELNYSFNDMTSFEQSLFHQVPAYELKKLVLNNCVVRNSDITHIKNIKPLTMLDLSNGNNTKLFNCLTKCDELFNKPRWDDCLKILYLNHLGISDLPDEIAQLAALEELTLSRNDLLWLPDTIVSLKNLRLLDLSFNKVVCLPNDFHKMYSLEIVHLAYNSLSRFTYSLPPNLKKLDLYDNLLDAYPDSNFSGVKIDLELNYLHTSGLNVKYQELKTLLRLDLDEDRIDGPKEPAKADPSSESSSASSYAPDDELQCTGIFFEDKFEEYWSSDGNADVCNNGCTVSDNEWTGSEEKSAIVKVRKKSIRRCPSWIFEDAPVS